jgi:hypothetical protein
MKAKVNLAGVRALAIDGVLGFSFEHNGPFTSFLDCLARMNGLGVLDAWPKQLFAIGIIDNDGSFGRLDGLFAIVPQVHLQPPTKHMSLALFIEIRRPALLIFRRIGNAATW